MADAVGLQKINLMQGRFHIFQRKNTPFWWVGFYHKGKHIRETTKETNRKVAESFAEKWYFKKQSQIEGGQLVTSTKTFGSAAKKAMLNYKEAVNRGERSAATLEGISLCLKARVLPYFEKKPIESITNQSWFEFKDYIYKTHPNAKRGTLHQYKNALRVVLNDAYREGTIKSLPVFKDSYDSARIETPRPWFSHTEYKILLAGIRRHIKHLKSAKPRWVEGAEELYDYVIFGTNTGMRVSEMSNARFCDVEIHHEHTVEAGERKLKEFLILRNIKGKRGTGTCKSFYGAVTAYKRILARRKIKEPKKSTGNLFLKHHRDMFNVVLGQNNLKYSNTQPPAKRDFVSLRATYICYRLLNGADVYEVATNCRTSPEIIRESYAKYLGGEMFKDLNRVRTSLEGWDE
jgi:integrase